MKKILTLVLSMLIFNSMFSKNDANKSIDLNEINQKENITTNSPSTFKNPILPGFHPDPSICRAGDYYYLVNSSFEWFPGIPIYRSKDLVNWKLIGYGITRPGQVDFPKGIKDSNGIYAVTIRYHKGIFYLITTCIQGGGNFYLTATDPAGEWSNANWLDAKGIDPSLIWDDNDRCYYVGNGFLGKKRSWDKQQGIWMQELDLKQKKLIGPKKQITYGYASNAQCGEGPHLYKIKNKYLLLMAEGGTDRYHSVTQHWSDSLWGPYVPSQINPILTHRNLGNSYPIHSVGHADFVETQNGELWMVALGKRNFNGYSYLSRETFLVPMKFETTYNEPTVIVNEGKGRIESIEKRPNLPWTPYEKSPIKDEFNNSKLALEWNFLRTPMSKWYECKNGKLIINLRPEVADSLVNPSLIVKRMEATKYKISTMMDFKSTRSNEQAGIIIYRTSNANIKFLREGNYIVLTAITKGVTTEIERVECGKENSIILQAISDGKDVSFSFGKDNQKMISLKNKAPLNIISDEESWGFNGPYVGMYATSNGKKSKAKASYDWFIYEEL